MGNVKAGVSKTKTAVRKVKAASAPHDREETRRRIMLALGRVLARKGPQAVGINEIAREAKTDKVLIYRYFGGLQELYSAFARECDPFPRMEELTDGRVDEIQSMPLARATELMLVQFGRAIRRNALTREIMRWELLESNALTKAMAVERERQATDWLNKAPAELDLPAVVTLLAAGQAYLALRSKTVQDYNGINIRSEEGWERIERAVGQIAEAVLNPCETGASSARAKRRQSSSKQS